MASPPLDCSKLTAAGKLYTHADGPRGAPSKPWPSCVVFHAMHKSAGNTFVSVFTDAVHEMQGRRFYCDNGIWNYTLQRCPLEHKKFDAARCLEQRIIPAGVPTDAAHATPRLLCKGDALSMAATAPWMRPPCKYVTVFREPVSRLLSAYYYCRFASWDPLCGSKHFNFLSPQFGSPAHVQAFASHWGDFALRELLLHPGLRGRAASSMTPDNYVWFAWKRAVERTNSTEAGFHAASRKLSSGALFDVIGVVERFDDTCRLLDAVLPLPSRFRNYSAATKLATHSHGSERWKEHEVAAREKAKVDPVVRAALAWDLKLYSEVVLPRFDQQMVEAGLAPSPPRIKP